MTEHDRDRASGPVTAEMLFRAINPDEAEHAKATVECVRLWREAADRVNASLHDQDHTACPIKRRPASA